jgi:hypothetical protein
MKGIVRGVRRSGVEPLKEPRDTRALIPLPLVGFLAASTAKLAPMEFVAHQPEPTVAKGAEFHRARDSFGMALRQRVTTLSVWSC